MSTSKSPLSRSILGVAATLVFVAVTAGSGCGGTDRAMPAVSPTPALHSPVPSSASSPPAVPALVQRVMDAFSVGDAVAIDGLMDPIRMACQVTTTYGLRCPPGTAEGTMLPVIWSALSCAGFGWSVMGATLPRTLNLALPLRQYGYRPVAIAGSNENLDLAQRIAGITRFLFFESRGEPARGLVVGMSDSGIRLLSTMCGSSVADMIAGSPWPSLRYLDQP